MIYRYVFYMKILIYLSNKCRIIGVRTKFIQVTKFHIGKPGTVVIHGHRYDFGPTAAKMRTVTVVTVVTKY